MWTRYLKFARGKGNMNLYKKACRKALLDIYWDLAACNKLMKSHPDWDWLLDKKAELEAKERELVKELA